MLSGLGGSLAWWALTGEGDLSDARRWFNEVIERMPWTRGDRKLSQTFFTGCKYNSNIAAQLFTRESLQQRSPEVSKKSYKDSK